MKKKNHGRMEMVRQIRETVGNNIRSRFFQQRFFEECFGMNQESGFTGCHPEKEGSASRKGSRWCH